MQSVERLCSILHDFNWQCARTVPLHQQSFLFDVSGVASSIRRRQKNSNSRFDLDNESMFSQRRETLAENEMSLERKIHNHIDGAEDFLPHEQLS